MPSVLPPTLEQWLRDPTHPEVPASWVPGLNKRERQALSAVGGVARGLLADDDVLNLPAEVREWLEDAPTPPNENLDAFRSALEGNTDEAFASLYSTIVSRENRRQLGTFFTPSAEVKLMLDLWEEASDSAPEVVIDVGAGVGVFTAEAAHRWPDARIIAVDINPVTLGLLAARLFSRDASADADDFKHRIELVRRDYTEWFASDDAPASGRRLILGNPPYTRAQLLGASERERLRKLTGDLCGSRASLSSIITAQTLLGLGPTDGLSLLLPAQWLESQYARNLRDAIWKQYNRPVELRLVESEDLFGGAQVDAVALVIGAKRGTRQPFRLARWRKAIPIELDRSITVLPSWRRPFDESGRVSDWDDSIPLADLATVKRGVATGANAVFVLSNEQASDLPSTARTRVITRLSEFGEAVSDDTLSKVSSRAAGWLLTMTEAQVRVSPALTALVDAGEMADVHERVLCSRREVWYDLTAEVRRPDVFVGAMTQGRFRLVENSVGATHTNNLYGLTWKVGLSDVRRRNVLEWLRSDDGQSALAAVARRQGAGLLKLEPGGMRSLRVPKSALGSS